MKIRLLRNCNVPTARWEKNCDCCGKYRVYPDNMEWCLKGEVIDPDVAWNEINLAGHKDTFKFGEDYEIIEYP